MGASAGLGRSLSTELARTGYSILLVAGDARDLDAQASDLTQRFGVRVIYTACRIGDRNTAAAEIARRASELGEIDALFFPIGFAREDDDGRLSGLDSSSLFAINLFAVIDLVTLLTPQSTLR